MRFEDLGKVAITTSRLPIPGILSASDRFANCRFRREWRSQAKLPDKYGTPRTVEELRKNPDKKLSDETFLDAVNPGRSGSLPDKEREMRRQHQERFNTIPSVMKHCVSLYQRLNSDLETRHIETHQATCRIEVWRVDEVTMGSTPNEYLASSATVEDEVGRDPDEDLKERDCRDYAKAMKELTPPLRSFLTRYIHQIEHILGQTEELLKDLRRMLPGNTVPYRE